MKKILFSVFFIASTLLSYCQKIKPIYNEETKEVSIDGEYYIMMEKIKGLKNFSIKNKNGEELIYMKLTSRLLYNKQLKGDYNSDWYSINFTESGSWLWEPLIGSWREKKVMKILIKNKLIKEGELDWTMALSYLNKAKGEIIIPEPKGPSNSVVSLINGEIFQDDVKIGKVIERHTETERVYHVYDNLDSKILVATIAKKDPFEWTMSSSKEDTYQVVYEGDEDGIKLLTYMASKGLFKNN